MKKLIAFLLLASSAFSAFADTSGGGSAGNSTASLSGSVSEVGGKYCVNLRDGTIQCGEHVVVVDWGEIKAVDNVPFGIPVKTIDYGKIQQDNPFLLTLGSFVNPDATFTFQRYEKHLDTSDAFPMSSSKIHVTAYCVPRCLNYGDCGRSSRSYEQGVVGLYYDCGAGRPGQFRFFSTTASDDQHKTIVQLKTITVNGQQVDLPYRWEVPGPICVWSDYTRRCFSPYPVQVNGIPLTQKDEDFEAQINTLYMHTTYVCKLFIDSIDVRPDAVLTSQSGQTITIENSTEPLKGIVYIPSSYFTDGFPYRVSVHVDRVVSHQSGLTPSTINVNSDVVVEGRMEPLRSPALDPWGPKEYKLEYYTYLSADGSVETVKRIPLRRYLGMGSWGRVITEYMQSDPVPVSSVDTGSINYYYSKAKSFLKEAYGSEQKSMYLIFDNGKVAVVSPEGDRLSVFHNDDNKTEAIEDLKELMTNYYETAAGFSQRGE